MDSDRSYPKKVSHKDRNDNYQKNSGSGKKFNIVSSEKKDNFNEKIGSTKIQPQIHLISKYTSYDWNSTSLEELYASFKEIEKVLKVLVEVSHKFEINSKENPKQGSQLVSDFALLRDHLVSAWERIFQENIKYAFDKEIDKRLWFLIKRPIELMSKEKKKEEGHKENLIKLIDKHIEIIKKLIQRAKEVYSF